MSYQVLARKWRPRNFQEMVGQQHVLRALVNALEHDRLHHAYLFTGTRGVGKTTVARILAKCLNCETGVTAVPCGACASCREIAEGRSVDLIEVDAASRTKVEDTRDLLDNVQYTPTRARFKIYLIDEVHMLSNHSFNALLKTLEEPPPHAKFLLATTDPQKLPATILSRCLQFNLKNMVPEQVVEHLQAILADEGIAYELPALSLLGRAAAGSMRDALSLTDQAIAYGSGSLVESDVRDMLGTVDRNRVVTLLSAVSSGNASAVLAGVDEISQHAPDYGATLEELIALLHQVTLMQMVPEMMQTQTAEEQSLVELARQMSLDESQLCYQFAINGRRDLPVAPDPRIALEMTLLRMIAFKPVEAPGGAGEPPGGAEEAPPAKKPEPPAQPVASQSAAHEGENRVSRSSSPAPQEPQTSASGPPLPTRDNWPEFFETLGLVGITHSVALHLELMVVTGDRLEFVLDRNNATLFQERQVDTLALAFGQVLGRSVTVDIQLGEVGEQTPQHRRALRAAERQRQAELALNEDPELAALIAEFDGRLVEGSIRPR